MEKRIILACIAFAVVAVFAGVIKTKIVSAGTTKGWMWGGSNDGNMTGVGTISTGVGWIDLDGGNLSVPSGDGNLSGHAWCSNIGWISFNAADLSGCPSAPCSARRESDNLKGWARFLSIKDALAAGNSGGWEGWIKLDGLTTDSSGKINGGYAWSNELGAINPLCVASGQYECSLVSTGAECDSTNFGTTIKTKEAFCSREHVCPGDPILTKADCENNGETCPADVTETCPGLREIGKWREVSP